MVLAGASVEALLGPQAKPAGKLTATLIAGSYPE